jgi:hypothetical protein
MTMLRDDDVIEAMAERHAPGRREEVASQLRDVWLGVAPDLSPEEQAAVVWSLSPLAVSPGSIGHRAHFARVASTMFPGLDRGKATARLRSILRRPIVVAALAAIRAEETAYLLAERSFVREVAFGLAAERAPEDYEPKDRIAHGKTRLAAARLLMDLDGLGPDAAQGPAPAASDDLRKKLVDRLSAIGQKFLTGETSK